MWTAKEDPEKEVEKQIGLKKKVAIDETKWCNAVSKLSKNMQSIRPPPSTEKNRV